jgi:hypothetical protein
MVLMMKSSLIAAAATQSPGYRGISGRADAGQKFDHRDDNVNPMKWTAALNSP